MNSIQWRHTLVAVFMAVSLGLLLLFNAQKPQVLMVHARSADHPASVMLLRGVQDTLRTNRQPLVIEHVHLDLNLNPSAAARRQALLALDRVLARHPPDLVALVDDEARLLVEPRLKPEWRVLRVSTNVQLEAATAQPSRALSATTESLPLAAVAELLAHLQPQRPLRLGFLASHTPSGRLNAAKVAAFDWGGHRLLPPQTVTTESQWREALTALGAQADVVLVSDMGGLQASGSDPLDLQALCQWTETHAKPLPIGLSATYASCGGGLTVLPSRREEGRLALMAALQWLDPRRDGTPPAPLAVDHFEVHITQQALQRRGIALPLIYLEAARDMGTLRP